MVKDMVETLANRPSFSVTVHSCADGNIELGSNDVRGFVALILHRQRTRNGLSLPQGRATARREVRRRIRTLRARGFLPKHSAHERA